PDAGSVERAPPDLTVGYLAQEVHGLPGETLLGHLARRTGVAEVQREMDDALTRMTEEPEAVEPYLTALARFHALGGEDLEARGATSSGSATHGSGNDGRRSNGTRRSAGG